MARVKINNRFCKGCELCVVNCPKRCLRLADKVNERGVHVAVFDEAAACGGCGNCAAMCPDAAIEIC